MFLKMEFKWTPITVSCTGGSQCSPNVVSSYEWSLCLSWTDSFASELLLMLIPDRNKEPEIPQATDIIFFFTKLDNASENTSMRIKCYLREVITLPN